MFTLHFRPGHAGVALIQIFRLGPFQLSHLCKTMIRTRVGTHGKMLEIMSRRFCSRGLRCPFSQSSCVGIGAPSLSVLCESMQLLTGLVIGLCRLPCVSSFQVVCSSQKVEGRLHNLRTRVSLSERFRFPQDRIGGLCRLQLGLALAVIFLCDRISECGFAHAYKTHSTPGVKL